MATAAYFRLNVRCNPRWRPNDVEVRTLLSSGFHCGRVRMTRRAKRKGVAAMSVSPDPILTFLTGLRAVKEYTSEPVADATIESVLEVGRWTGTGSNKQPIEVVVIRDDALKNRCGDWGAKPAATAAVVLLLVVQNDGPALDEGRMAERLCLGAAANGLGSTVATLKNEGPDAIKQQLGIPAEHRARTVIAIGHIDVEARKNRVRTVQGGRKPLSEYAHWDRW
jgi:nitroreductase